MQPSSARKLIASGEGQRVEFKATTSETRPAIESLCAFAHSHGGTVFFGVDDGGRVIGQQIGKATLENLANEVRRHTQPPMSPVIETVTLDGITVIAVSTKRVPNNQLVYAFDQAWIRVGRTNQKMTPDDVRKRLFKGFRAENLLSAAHRGRKTESWKQREGRRVRTYEQARGLFLVHESRLSTTPGQVADIVIYLRQHREGPLTEGTVKSVEYHLGPMFFDRTVVKTDPADSFRLEVSAYGPMLCLARVNFDDGSPSIDLERYVDF